LFHRHNHLSDSGNEARKATEHEVTENRVTEKLANDNKTHDTQHTAEKSQKDMWAYTS